MVHADAQGKASGSCGASWPASLRPYGPAILYAAGLVVVTKLEHILFFSMNSCRYLPTTF